MNNLSISAKHLKEHLLELKSSYEKEASFRNREKITLFGFMQDGFGPMITPVSFENKYYPDRNIWVICIIRQKRRYDILGLENIESGFSFEQVLEFLGNNLEKPVYVYERDTFYPIYKTDIKEWIGQFGILGGLPNHLKEPIDENPLDGFEDIIKQAKYCVTIKEYHEENGAGDPDEFEKTPDKYYFKNLPSAKLFYNKIVAGFMENTLSDYKTNYNEFSQSSLSWHGWKYYMVNIFGFGPAWRQDHLVIDIESITIKYESIEGEYELV